jgi:hypothetical protein
LYQFFFCFFEKLLNKFGLGTETGTGAGPEPKLFQSRNRNRNTVVRFQNTGIRIQNFPKDWIRNSKNYTEYEHCLHGEDEFLAVERVADTQLGVQVSAAQAGQVRPRTDVPLHFSRVLEKIVLHKSETIFLQ